MSKYAIGNIYGQLDKFKELLSKINFEENGNVELYMLGNYCDIGEKSVETIFYIMELDKKCKNVNCLVGSHDLMLMRQLNSYNHTPNMSDIYYDKNYLYNKQGKKTFNDVLKYELNEQIKLERWIDSLQYRFDLNINNKKVILVHSDIEEIIDKDINRDLFDVNRDKAVFSSETRENCNEKILKDILNNSDDMDKNIEEYRLKNKFDILVTGSSSNNNRCDTMQIYGGCIYDIDCGVEYIDSLNFGRLSALNLETSEIIYI